MKLWTIKTNECVKTLDAHQDKVWGLHVSRQDHKMVTGSADSTITIWDVSSTHGSKHSFVVLEHIRGDMVVELGDA